MRSKVTYRLLNGRRNIKRSCIRETPSQRSLEPDFETAHDGRYAHYAHRSRIFVFGVQSFVLASV
jgi:hypothetical protein